MAQVTTAASQILDALGAIPDRRRDVCAPRHAEIGSIDQATSAQMHGAAQDDMSAIIAVRLLKYQAALSVSAAAHHRNRIARSAKDVPQPDRSPHRLEALRRRNWLRTSGRKSLRHPYCGPARARKSNC